MNTIESRATKAEERKILDEKANTNGFQSKQELERVRTIVKTNYFSGAQYIKRWCGRIKP